MKRFTLSTAMIAVAAASLGTAMPSAALAQQRPGAVKPVNDVALSVGTGRMVQLNGTMSDLFVANDGIADVQVRSANQIYIFGKSQGETTVYATNKAGKVIYSANVRVATNIGSVGEMLDIAMPEADIRATPMNGMVLLTGTVAAPEDIEEASRLVQSFVGDGTKVISRLKTATPLTVMLQVKIAEVSRSVTREFGVNLLAQDRSSGFLFGLGRGNPGTIEVGDDGVSRFTFTQPESGTALAAAGNLLGVDILATLNLNENAGLVTTLAEPTLTALSGETASFLAGGEFPIATTSGLNGTSIEFKEYGVSLAFTPTVLQDGKISMRVRPEVSELVAEGAIKIAGFEIPGLSTRRAETTVELGSGQSFMIGGLLRNNGNNVVEKAPWLGDLPILGTLFRSKSFRRNESELVIVVTPYLVKPISASQVSLPTDGFRVPNDAQRILGDQRHDGRTGEQRPRPVLAPNQNAAPAISGGGAAAAAQVPTPAPAAPQPKQAAAPAPGFSF